MTIKNRLNKLENKKQCDTFSLLIDLGNGEILNLGNCDVEELKTALNQGNNVLRRLQGENK